MNGTWQELPIASILEAAERTRAHLPPPGDPGPITAEGMARLVAGPDLGRPPAGAVVLPDYVPWPTPPAARLLVATVGDQGSVGSTLKTAADFLHPPKGPEAPVEEIVFWARKWETRYFETLPGAPFQRQRVWLKLWGLPALLLQPGP